MMESWGGIAIKILVGTWNWCELVLYVQIISESNKSFYKPRSCIVGKAGGLITNLADARRKLHLDFWQLTFSYNNLFSKISRGKPLLIYTWQSFCIKFVPIRIGAEIFALPLTTNLHVNFSRYYRTWKITIQWLISNIPFHYFLCPSMVLTEKKVCKALIPVNDFLQRLNLLDYSYPKIMTLIDKMTNCYIQDFNEADFVRLNRKH